MELFLKELAQTLDGWANEKRALITESDEVVVVGGLSAIDAGTLSAMVRDTFWTPAIEDATETVIGSEDISEDFGPFKITLSKAGAPSTVSTVLTNTAFASWLTRKPERPIVWVARLDTAFESHEVRFAPWGDATEFTATPVRATARKLVREGGTQSLVPADLGPWLLKEGMPAPWNESAAKVWINLAAIALFNSLTNEVEASGALMFRGPPVVRYSILTPPVDTMSPAGFNALQIAARWVFESDHEAETRHGLLTAELARTSVANLDASVLFDKGASPSLEGAKIALQLGLHKLSLDSLKAMADLRKAVTDETTKLSDATRQLATAVAGALFAGIGIIAARLTIAVNGPIVVGAILILGIVLCAYVASVIISGCQFVGIQRELRTQWRERLYRFLPEAEYNAMVSGPAIKAEQGFRTAAVIGGMLAGLLLVAVVAVTFVPNPTSQAKKNAPAATSSDDKAEQRGPMLLPNGKGMVK